MTDGPLRKTAAAAVINSPYRNEVLSLYRRMLKAAFTVEWVGGFKAAKYVLTETRYRFRQNMHVIEAEKIEKKIEEAEFRYGLALHYRIPFPRPYNYMTGATVGLGAPVHSRYMDSMREQGAPNPNCDAESDGNYVHIRDGCGARNEMYLHEDFDESERNERRGMQKDE